MGEKMERHTMTGKKRGKKMKAVKAWAVIQGRDVLAVGYQKKSAIDAAVFLCGGDPDWKKLASYGYRCVKVEISEIPSGRGK